MDRDRRDQPAETRGQGRLCRQLGMASGFATSLAGELAQGFRERVDARRPAHTRGTAIRGHGAQAVDRALALRRDRGNTGWRRDPGGDNSRRIDRQELPPAAFASGDTGNATVFFFGGTTPPRFRWVWRLAGATPRA